MFLHTTEENEKKRDEKVFHFLVKRFATSFSFFSSSSPIVKQNKFITNLIKFATIFYVLFCRSYKLRKKRNELFIGNFLYSRYLHTLYSQYYLPFIYFRRLFFSLPSLFVFVTIFDIETKSFTFFVPSS